MKKTSLEIRFLLPLVFVTMAISICQPCSAQVKLPGFFTDHMVLQQQMELPVWGWAAPGEEVEVKLGDTKAVTVTNQEGTWRVKLPKMKASKQPIRLRVRGKNEVVVEDILIGEVWLCSGQSNMEWRVKQSSNAAEEIAAGSFPFIRQMKVGHVPSPIPLNDIQSQWQICTPETVGDFTAVGYFMARRLYKELDIPIGLINSSWGGTRVEPWAPPIGFRNVPATKSIFDSVVGRTPGTQRYKQLLAKHIGDTEKWLSVAKRAESTNQLLTPPPVYPADLTPFKSHQDPTMLYNGMIHALVGFPIRGAIWYQGESNRTDGMMYYEKKKALVNGWRNLWGQGDFPFYYVQIAPYQYGNDNPSVLAELWEAQAAVQELPNTGMVVINDIATLNDIHPPNKQDVGERLALLALKNQYGQKNLIANSPEFESLELGNGRLVVGFNNTGGELKTRDGKSPTHFEIVGPGSNGFQPANAEIVGETVVLTSAAVVEPTAVRFAWHKLAEPNLTGATGLPVGAFRRGTVPGFLSSVPGGKEYTLVYELDLGKLGTNIKYDFDDHQRIGRFDRIGYLLELESTEHGQQKRFVTMNAFTDDVSKIGIPTAASKAHFQQNVDAVEVFSAPGNSSKVRKISKGNIEFWPNNYAASNGANVPGASATVYDFGDQPGAPITGYGSMQIHDHVGGETLFSINNWNAGVKADIGIGNSKGRTRDWTFTANANKYSLKKLSVYVRSRN